MRYLCSFNFLTSSLNAAAQDTDIVDQQKRIRNESRLIRNTLILVSILVFATNVHAAPPKYRPLNEAGVTEYRNVRYLPDWRYPEKDEELRTGQMTMDIAVPDDERDRHPVMFVVHGGGWGGGTKDTSGIRETMTYFVERGYVVVGLNYILRPRGIMPQVFWDFETATRYLRKNAAAYQVDPNRFGAIGLSAGGWLISSVGHGSGDLFLRNHQQSSHIAELEERGWLFPDDDWNESFLRPLANPTPVYPNVYGRLQAISMDFHFRIQYGTGNSPSLNNWMGRNGRMRDEQEVAAASGRFDYSRTDWIHPKYAGKSVHVPPLFRSTRKQGNEAAAIGFDGKQSDEAIEQIYRYFQHQFYETPRTPVPAFRPTSRFFKESLTIRFLLPEMEATPEIRFQVVPLERTPGKQWKKNSIDVSGDEWKEWQLYKAPFTINGNCQIRAVATSPDRRPSTIAEAHFFKGVELPEVTAPVGNELPPGKTGERYEVKFTSSVASARWFLAGDLVPWSFKGEHFPNNMVLNTSTGQWSGTPVKPGRYWVQIWVNDNNGALSNYRDYSWNVSGADLAPTEELFRTSPVDPFVELAFLTNTVKKPNRLAEPLRKVGIRSVFQEDDAGATILVSEDKVDDARHILKMMLKKWKLESEVEWRNSQEN